MIGRPLAILSEGRLTSSQVRALTLASLGWIEITLSDNEIAAIRKKRSIRVIYPIQNPRDKQQKRDAEERLKRIKEEDEEMLAIIRTFISCQNLETV